MMCLSIRQPYAHLIAAGIKRFETRSWSTRYRGPLAIHASRSWTGSERESLRYVNDVLQRWPRNSGPSASWPSIEGSTLDLGAIIAIVDLVEILAMEGEEDRRFSFLERQLGYFDTGRYAWKLSAPVALETPIRMRGNMGLFGLADRIKVEMSEDLARRGITRRVPLVSTSPRDLAGQRLMFAATDQVEELPWGLKP
jgi:activating signal cointegrator 1